MLHDARKSVFLCLAVFLGIAAAVSALPTEPAALDFANIRSLSTIDPNLTGEGVLIGTICRSKTYLNGQPQNDFRFNMGHDSLYDADVMFSDGTDGLYGTFGHATSIAGLLLGLDKNASNPNRDTFDYRGACPDASVNAYEFEDFVINNLLSGNQVFDENIFSLSLGDDVEREWMRGLEQAALEHDLLVVASVGNGIDARNPTPIYPGAGANVLGVGLIDSIVNKDANGTISLLDFSTPKPARSSTGPTGDQRCKPDIVAPGTAWVPSGNGTGGYVFLENASSLAAPIATGTAALLYQKGTTDPTLKKAFDREGKGLLIKTLLMNSARKLPFWHKGYTTPDDDLETPLDFSQGAGLLDAVAAYEQLTAGKGKPGSVNTVGWDNRILQDSNGGHIYAFNVTEPNQMITATLCWNRVYESQSPYFSLSEQDTNLRLELWGIDLNDPDNRVLLDYSDSVNDNVEHIYFACDPNYIAYAIRVRFNEEQPSDAKQRFALAWSVGPDRQIGNKWWNDLNEDNIINTSDNVIYSLMDSNLINKTEMAPLVQSLGLSEDRLQLLTEGWEIWKPYLSNLEIAE